MKYKWKRVLAVVFLFIIVAGWYVTVCGIGPVKPIQDRMKLGLDIKGGVYVVMEAKTDLKGEELQKAMEQTQAVIEERVNQMGLAEPVVTIEGDKRIRVELPAQRMHRKLSSRSARRRSCSLHWQTEPSCWMAAV